MLKNSANCASSLYEQVADRIRALIHEGTLRPGDRLPSVRKLHQQFSVSISTVLEAYRLLEDQGWIGARPQSGYYVKPLMSRAEPKPSASLKHDFPVDVSLAFRVSSEMRDRKNIDLGHAIPGLDLLPIASLNRIANRIVREQPTALHSYNAPNGSEVLRHEVARRSIEAGCAFSPNDLIITNGATEAIHLALRAVTQPGDIIAIESPTYYGFLEILESLHLKALEIPTEPKEGILLEPLESALKHRKIAACLIVSNFSNPLGSCMSDRKKQQLVELLNRFDVPLIEDDVYGELYFSNVRPKAIKAFDTEERVLYCSSVSKTLSPGLRVGWCAAGRYQIKVERLKMAMNWTTATVPQLTVAEFLSNGGCDRHFRQIRRSYQTQMIQMTQAICDEFPADTKVTQPSGGQVLWLELPIEFDAIQLYRIALQHQISVAPGMMFSPTGAYRNCLRLNCGLPWSTEIEIAMQILGRLTKELINDAG
ncbi:MAG: PLP-dependent aminotransferase family protein [Plectolyngbya sp. WJT66-NPBG17]|jgi:DNA-binding transcriptional MocR family regulator|nr:PLP-dependent aminotransferase family protein [Plectolyngbya sp. WJT66-NPBG17]MBW4524080.1 PLP-dependent aminotransferase family protein [Phormidium tanganyikae FI6-MK23]